MSYLRSVAGSLIKAGAKHIYYTVPVQYRYGKRFRDIHQFLMDSQWWSTKALQEYQMKQLSKVLKHAYENVPYYRAAFSERGLKPEDIQDFNDFRKLPFLSKDDLRNRLDELVATNIPKDTMEWETTGGSTAQPLGIFSEKRNGISSLAFEWRQWNWMGFAFDERYALVRGNFVDCPNEKTASWWKYDRKRRSLILSSFEMTKDTVGQYLEKIEQFEPAMIRGYPSSLELLAKYSAESNLSINRKGTIRSISTSSETLLPIQKRLIEAAFQCPVFDLYGNGELAGKMGECERHEGLHDFMEYSYTEIVDFEGKPVNQEGAIGELVVTGFTNYAVPLIRYKIGDLAQFTSRTCSCGRGLSLIANVRGRVQELIVAKDGGLIPLGPAIFGIHDAEWTKVRQLQFVQEEKGKVTIRVVKSQLYPDFAAEKYVRRLFSERFKDRVTLEIHFVSEIPTTNAGKHKFLIQKLPVSLESLKSATDGLAGN